MQPAQPNQMNNQTAPLTRGDDQAADQPIRSETSGSDDGEFKLTVKKLEFSVRPRGVLAE